MLPVMFVICVDLRNFALNVNNTHAYTSHIYSLLKSKQDYFPGGSSAGKTRAREVGRAVGESCRDFDVNVSCLCK